LGKGADIRAEDIQYTPRVSNLCYRWRFSCSHSSKLIGAYMFQIAWPRSQLLYLVRESSLRLPRRELLRLMEFPGEWKLLTWDKTSLRLWILPTHRTRCGNARSRTHDDKGRVIVVFGSAGLRDKEKRCMMAETSAELADLSV